MDNQVVDFHEKLDEAQQASIRAWGQLAEKTKRAVDAFNEFAKVWVEILSKELFMTRHHQESLLSYLERMQRKGRGRRRYLRRMTRQR